jgi:hypothetical protein
MLDLGDGRLAHFYMVDCNGRKLKRGEVYGGYNCAVEGTMFVPPNRLALDRPVRTSTEQLERIQFANRATRQSSGAQLGRYFTGLPSAS